MFSNNLMGTFFKLHSDQARRMSQFNEGEKEERRKYQRTAKVLTLFIVFYMGQWLSAIVLYIWLFITPPPTVMVSTILTETGLSLHLPQSWWLYYLL